MTTLKLRETKYATMYCRNNYILKDMLKQKLSVRLFERMLYQHMCES